MLKLVIISVVVLIVLPVVLIGIFHRNEIKAERDRLLRQRNGL